MLDIFRNKYKCFEIENDRKYTHGLSGLIDITNKSNKLSNESSHVQTDSEL